LVLRANENALHSLKLSRCCFCKWTAEDNRNEKKEKGGREGEKHREATGPRKARRKGEREKGQRGSWSPKHKKEGGRAAPAADKETRAISCTVDSCAPDACLRAVKRSLLEARIQRVHLPSPSAAAGG